MKSTRAYAKRLVMANWKGIIFHSFDLDRNVTGLEGDNGAGKTTVMAAYVTAILPNQRLLEFKNAGGARSDSGMWGRLGQDGICYALIEWVPPRGKAVWAGVALIRGAMPAIDMTPIIIEDLPADATPYDAMLVRAASGVIVPPLAKLREHVAMQGGRLTVQKTLADYMKALFDFGITPMPMTSFEEQERFYRVLSTSMEGTALASLIKTGLRDYLLAPDPSLERRVVLMRESLTECRQTKRELERAQSAHAEISDLFDVAWKMSSYAYFGSRGRYEQEARNWREQVSTCRAAFTQLHAHQTLIERLQRGLGEFKQELARAQADAAAKHFDLANKENARSLRIGLKKTMQEAGAAERAMELALERRTLAEAAEQHAGRLIQQAQGEYARIAEELGDAQKAVEALIRRVAELRVARALLADAQAAMLPDQVERHSALEVKHGLDRRYEEQTRAQTEAQAKLDAWKDHQTRFETLLKKVQAIYRAQGAPSPSPSMIYRRALELEASLRAYTAEAADVDRLESELVNARDAATRQQALRKQAAGLGIDGSAALSDALTKVHTLLEQLDAEQAGLTALITERQSRLVEAQGRVPALQDAERRYSEARSCRNQLATLVPDWPGLPTLDSLTAAITAGQSELSDIGERRRAIETALYAATERIRSLQQNSRGLDPRLATVAEHVDGRLLAGQFDELSTDDAACAQARLGIWTEAIIVAAPEHAAREATDLFDRPDTLLFVSEQAVHAIQQASSLEDSELILERVNGKNAARLTRRSAHPVLGRRAREAEIVRLHGKREELASDLAQLREDYRVLKEGLALGERLVSLGPVIWGPDTQLALATEQANVRALLNRIAQLHKSLADSRDGTAAAAFRRACLSPLEAHRVLLDPPDLAQQVMHLEHRLQRGRAAQAWIEQHGGVVRQVLDSLPILATVPDASARALRQSELDRLKISRDRLSHQRDALEKLLAVIEHLDRTDDEENHYKKSSVIAALQANLAPAKARMEEANRQLNASREQFDDARQSYSEASAQVSQFHEKCRAINADLRKTRVQGTEEEVTLAREACESADVAAGQVEARLAQTKEMHLRETLRLEGIQADVREQRRQASQRLSTFRFERRAQRDLDVVVRQLGLQGRIDSELNRQEHFPTGSLINAFQSSQNNQVLLVDRLKPWPEVLADLSRIEGFFEPSAERRAVQTLRAWDRVRLHIEQRIPRNLATVYDPQVALSQMTEKMGELQRTLDAQEDDMRGRSSGLADGITARQRSAASLVLRLNRELENVSFGSIKGLQIALSFPEDMASMLACLRRDSSLSLFDSGMSLEDTLARLYQRETGGTISGTRLFDYRNYLVMRLEVRRISGNWEATSDVSTGEAIGAGAAVLVMILRTWNEEANRISGSAGYALQQILLDEASRLDEKALDTLVEFCQKMDVQALVAAPGLEKPRRSTVFQLKRSMRGKVEFVTIRGTRFDR